MNSTEIIESSVTAAIATVHVTGNYNAVASASKEQEKIKITIVGP